jgi:hypothetical protein
MVTGKLILADSIFLNMNRLPVSVQKMIFIPDCAAGRC